MINNFSVMKPKSTALSRLNARKLPKRMRALRKSKHMKRWLLRNPWTRPICAFNIAAILIQSRFRGYIRRMKMLKLAKPKKIIKRKTQLNKYLAHMDACRFGNKRKPTWLDGGYSVWCIVRIQAWFRMLKIRIRHTLQRHVVNQIAAIVIQAAWKNSKIWLNILRARKAKYSPEVVDINAEVRKIQNLVRRCLNKRVYRYLRDLVLVKFKGAPADLLRSIIPREVDLFDKASGVHVRFRLGGIIFPPKIMFKVFTHRALCDVNAFAPRSYCTEKPMDPIQLHNNLNTVPARILKNRTIRVGGRYFDSIVTTNSINGEGWYRREDNNEWRPIAQQIFDDSDGTDWLKSTLKEKKPAPFHYSREKRTEDKVNYQKKRKKQWMLKAYRLAAGDDLLGSHGLEEPSLNESSASRMSSQERIKSSFKRLTGGRSGGKLDPIPRSYQYSEEHGMRSKAKDNIDPEYRSPSPLECYQTLLSDDKRGEFDKIYPGMGHSSPYRNTRKPMAPDNGIRYLPPVYSNDPATTTNPHHPKSNSRSVFNKCKVTRDINYYSQLKAADDDIVKWG